MHTFRTRLILSGLAACLLATAFLASQAELAASPLPLAADDTTPPQGKAPKKPGYRLQPGDDEALPIDEVNPRTKQGQARIDALGWFMTGRLREKRNDFKGAYEAYQRAVAIDPTAVAIYRVLVPLAFSLHQTDDAVKYAMKAIELDPNDYELLRRLGIHMAKERKIVEAVDLLEKAANSKSLKKDSVVYVSLMRDLSTLYSALAVVGENTDRYKAKAADAFKVIYDAIVDPGRFNLDKRTRDALLADPRTSLERIGRAFLDAKRPELAVQAFERAAKSGRGSAGSLGYNLARVNLQTGKSEKALDQLQKYFDAQLQSKGRNAYQLLEDILKKLKKSDELVSRLERLAEKDKRNSTLQYFLADRYVAAKQLDKAEALYKETLEASGGSEGYAGLVGIYRERKQAGPLLDVLVKAVKGGRGLERLEPELKAISQNGELIDGLIDAGRKQLTGDEPKLEIAAAIILAKLAAEAKKTAAAIDFYQFALKGARQEQANALYNELGDHLMEVRNFAEAAKVFRKAASDPALSAGRPNYLFRLSQAHELSGNTKSALEAVAEARKILPDVALLHYQEGWVHYHAENWDKAVRIFEQVMAKYPQETDILRRCQFSLSNIYVQQGNIRKGEQILEKVLEADPDDPSVNNDLGYLYADQNKNLEKAEKMIRKAIKAEPENAAYLDSMGWVLYRLGKYAEAITHLEKAVKLSTGSDGTIRDHLGDCYHKLAKKDKAVGAWQDALKAAKSTSSPDKELIRKIEKKLQDAGVKPKAAPSASKS